MSVIKNSSSGRALFFIDESGTVFSTSWDWVDKLRTGKIKTGFLVLSRLPNPVSVDRFPPSPTWNPENGTISTDEITTSNDAFSKKTLSKKNKPVQDVEL